MLSGKGMWIWQVKRCGGAETIATKAAQGGLTYALVKLADGTNKYWGAEWGNTEHDYAMDMVHALLDRDIEAVIWDYIYGDYPEQEADMIISRIHEVGRPIKTLVLDVEKEYKRQGWGARAVRFCQRIRAALPDIILGLSSYRFPTLHREIPWAEFGQFVNIYFPQVYWAKAHNPVEQLGRCLREYKALPYLREVIPAGSAYKEYGWQPDPGEVDAFLAAAKNTYACMSANLWEWHDAVDLYPYYWQEISNFSWGIGPPPPPPPPPPPGNLPNYFFVNTAQLRVRSTPEELADNSNHVGWIFRNSKWEPVELVYDNKSRKWWKINKYGYCAEWLTTY